MSVIEQDRSPGTLPGNQSTIQGQLTLSSACHSIYTYMALPVCVEYSTYWYSVPGTPCWL